MRIYIFFICLCSIFFNAGCNKVQKPKNDISYSACYVINGEGNSITVFDLNSEELTETCTFKKGTWPHHIYANSDKSQLLISMVGADLSGGHAGHGAGDQAYIILIDATDFNVLNCYKSDSPAHNAIFVKDDSEIWVPQMNSNGTIIRLSADNFKELGNIQVGNGPLEITTDINESFAFVCNGEDNTVSIIEIETNELIKTLNVGSEPVGAWPASNGKMYVDCEVSKEIFELDVSTLSITDTIALDFTPAYVSYNSVTTQLWVSDADNGGVQVYNYAGGNWIENTFISTGSNAHAIVFNADFSKAYVTNQNSNSLSVINAVTLTKTKDLNTGSKPNGILLKN